MLENNEGVTKNIYESNYEMQSYLRVTLKANTTYHLLIEGMVPYNLGSGTLDCDFYLKEADQQIEQVDLVEPVEYFDKYTPYKYGILFREKLYSSENTVSSVFLRLGKVEEGQQQQQEKDKKGAKKGAAGNGSDIQEQPLEEQRKIIFELYENDKLIQYTSGYNQAYLSFILLQANNQAEGKNYYLQAKFDLREWDGCKTASPETEGIHWFLKVQSSDTIGIVKDTAKEDREKAVAKSWEDGEPGRAAKAVNARKKLFLLKKQKQGEQLTEEELELLNEPRLTKKQREEEAQAGGKGKKAPPKKDEKKQAKKGGKQQKESQVYDKEIPIEKKYPLSKDHRMNEIRAFLKHMEEERVQEVLAAHQGLINVRSEENKQEIARKAEISVERLEQILSSSKELREQLSLLQNDQKAKIIKQFGEKSQITKEQWEQYQQKREEIKNSLSTKNTKEKELADICQSENPTISLESLEKLIEEAKAVPEMNQNLIELSYRVLKNFKINALKEKFNNALNTFDVETLKNCLQEFNDFSVTGIESDIIEKSEAMIQEASENPNFQAEKAAELKKAGKKGKK
ncbi:hypothetical protein PPERSA_07938 [Pseudocohnilembus persalinus]|uniref:Uncharacterized protein n=1 Tax=Pseudocohnilembus persalinus TaxID=266149 RepID=A0A0V0QB38_PSEPJ|nr:hypothetical protein PPERSA_07938 [Pseudocohnilembus persalinus]|eukprot:KRW99453.1 hypothetical protein PPERSA_07938 [Pseudocohnilembus persalinus]